jgi:hypothetical protein
MAAASATVTTAKMAETTTKNAAKSIRETASATTLSMHPRGGIAQASAAM